MLRTGGAALRTVTVLVDEVLRPALEDAGLPAAAVGLVRSPDREGARILVSLPSVLPLVILRGSGETTAALAREAAQHGVRTLAHAEGGGVLYIAAAADPAKAEALVEASLDRLGVCNRLNLLLVDRAAASSPTLRARCSSTARHRRRASPSALGHEWANDPEHIASVTRARRRSLEEAVAIANGETSGLAAAIVTEDDAAAQQFLDALPRHGSVLERDDAVHRRLRADRLAGDRASTSTASPGPRGPVTYRDL